jgi:protein-L-isoaspartate(D-aspartate) O-methyltransferase
MVTATADEDEACRLRASMVDSLRPAVPLSDRVVQAMRTVPRERFLPGVALQDAYSDDIVTTDRDADGTVLSCTTVPSTVAGMLEQLDVCPGHRVLEIGAGTGINAALLAHLAGPDGRVTTIDVLPEAADRARRHLAAAGYDTVQVITGDGACGYEPGAPYDRIIATTATWDIYPGWTGQAAPDARLVIPLRIAGFTREVTLTRGRRPGGPAWTSAYSHPSGFIKLRGPGHHGERDVPIVSGGQSELRVEDGIPVNQGALVRATSEPPLHRWTGVHPADLALPDLEIWLASLGGLTRLINRRPGHGLAPATGQGGSLAVLNNAGDTLAYLTFRKGAGEATARELGVCAYGPDSDQLADRVTGQIQAWADEQPTTSTTIEIYPIGTATPEPRENLLTVTKEHTLVAVRAAR